jgi:hypothetical protein
MQCFIRTLMAAASLALLASCASTGENTDQTEVDATTQPGVTAQPGQEAYSYAYGQAPGGYDSYDTSGSSAGAGQAGRPGQGAGGSVFPRTASSILISTRLTFGRKARPLLNQTPVIWRGIHGLSPSSKAIRMTGAAANTTSPWANAGPMRYVR